MTIGRGQIICTNLKIGGSRQKPSKEKSQKCGETLAYVKAGKISFLAFKLKALKGKLKDWSKTIQGNLEMQKQSILSQEEIQGHILLTDDEAHLRAALTVVFEENAKKGGSGLETKIKGFCGLMKGRETPNSFIEL